MITATDIAKLKETFVTKDEFADLRLEVGDISDKLDTLSERVIEMDAKFDRSLAAIHIAQTENSAQLAILNRHERQIQALAEGTGVDIPQD